SRSCAGSKSSLVIRIISCTLPSPTGDWRIYCHFVAIRNRVFLPAFPGDPLPVHENDDRVLHPAFTIQKFQKTVCIHLSQGHHHIPYHGWRRYRHLEAVTEQLPEPCKSPDPDTHHL